MNSKLRIPLCWKGLGLDISWRIVVNKHHGDLSVQSQPGDTRFRVTLPLSGAV